MKPRPVASLISRYLFVRTLVPAVACLALLVLFLAHEHKRAVEGRNREMAGFLANFARECLNPSGPAKAAGSHPLPAAIPASPRGEHNLKAMVEHMGHFCRMWQGEVIVCDGAGSVLFQDTWDNSPVQASQEGSPLFQAVRGGRGSLLYREDGRFYLGAGAVVPDLDWTVLVRTPCRDIFAQALSPVAGASLVTGAVFLAIITLVRRALDKRISLPMARAASGLSNQDGYLPIPRPEAPFAELHSFQQAIESMTDRVRTGQEQLRESERRFRAIFEQAAVGLVQCTPDWRFLRANRRFQEICGYPLDELRNMTFRDITLEEDLASDIEQRERLYSGELERFSLDKRYRRKDGDIVWVRLTASAVRSRPEIADYYVGVVEDVTARKTAEDALKASLAEKEVLLREVHHRVKNNLQVISSLLYLQSEKVSDRELLRLFLKSRTRIASMALVHEELYGSPDLSSVNIRQYLRKLVPRLFEAFGDGRSIQWRIEAEETACLTIDQAIPFGLIINELVTNAVRHAFKTMPNGSVQVDVARVDGSIRASVSDNGIGLPSGFDPAQAGSLGMQLILQLTKQLRGVLDIKQGKGAAFILVFPVKEPLESCALSRC